ncbi:DUF4350 domain-containing protein [Rubellicoccus peritrichatus]|uniref:DUF4350 domain-containing protein n=1 Tax=Rubellicoccus peritrichatus TaxID=3080537 RepID=A0AAQ3LEK2_9BACT|nr:DUF4350 domain-containing protein [Puniceicoccus sp. CR14]WOO42178.1 DUF4350 domain-containing protein [Puniceicoccus sp. CR14]
MSSKRSAPFVLLLIILIMMGAFYAVIHLRLERGDVYPPGSSFRADPLGGKALFESLESVPGIKVSRNFERFSDVQFGDNTVFILEAASPYDLEDLESDAAYPLRDSIAHGARLVVALKHQKQHRDSWDEELEIDDDLDEGDVESEVDETEEIHSDMESETLPGLYFSSNLSMDTVGPGAAELNPAFVAEEVSPLPLSLPWQETKYWSELSEYWDSVYTLDGQVVVAQRLFGRGSIVIMTDSYLLSNEGLLKNREPDFLTWLIGDKSVVVFDETHFGVTEPQGITLLIRSYKLGALALGLAFFTGLFVWKHLSTLVPPKEDFEEKESVVRVGRTGQDAQVDFIRRRLGADTLLDECVDLWARTCGRNDAATIKRVANARKIAKREGLKPVHKRDLVLGYQEITKILNTNRKSKS